MKTIIAKYTLASSLVLSVVHIASHGYVKAENFIAKKAKENYTATINGLANDLGYVKPQAYEELSFSDLIQKEALLYGINPRLPLALAKAESGKTLNPDAISEKGAVGIMQVMPFNAKACGLKLHELYNPEKNIKCGVYLFSKDLKRHRNDSYKAVQAYNGGDKCVDKCDESINHAKKVHQYLATDIAG